MVGFFLFGMLFVLVSNIFGDLKNDVVFVNGLEDSIFDIVFNFNLVDIKDLLVVVSWDKKVWIYEIMSNGQGEGRVVYDYDGLVFLVDFFKVW